MQLTTLHNTLPLPENIHQAQKPNWEALFLFARELGMNKTAARYKAQAEALFA